MCFVIEMLNSSGASPVRRLWEWDSLRYGPFKSCEMDCSGGNMGVTCGRLDAIQIYLTGAGPYTIRPASLLFSYNGRITTHCYEYVYLH